jgi:hypothetical protein
MRSVGALCLAAVLLFQTGNAHAAEKGLVIRADKLMAQPFIDAASNGAVAANLPVTILERRGGWANIESGGRKGWVRLLNLRLDPGNAVSARPTKQGKGIGDIFQTNSSGRTVTTGIKGMDEENIRNASVNYAELQRLGTLSVGASEARSNAAKNKLKESKVEYLKKGRSQ